MQAPKWQESTFGFKNIRQVYPHTLLFICIYLTIYTHNTHMIHRIKKLKLLLNQFIEMQVRKGRQLISSLTIPHTSSYLNDYSCHKTLGLHEAWFNERRKQRWKQWYHLPISYPLHLPLQALPEIQDNQSTVSPQDGKRCNVSNSS